MFCALHSLTAVRLRRLAPQAAGRSADGCGSVWLKGILRHAVQQMSFCTLLFDKTTSVKDVASIDKVYYNCQSFCWLKCGEHLEFQR